VQRLRLTWWKGLLVLALALGGVVAGLWLAPSDEYLLLPDKARAVAPLVKIEDADVREPAPGAGIYMVDILVRKANMLEQLFPGLNGDATLVPGRAFNPLGVSEQQRQQTSTLDMSRSQQIAAAVALESLGYDVQADPDGAQVDSVVPDAPASGKLQPGDVIVAANGKQVKTPGALRRAMADVDPGDAVEISYRRNGRVGTVTLDTEPADDEPNRAVIGVIVEQAASIELPVDISIEVGDVGGPSAGLAFALDIVDELGPDVDKGRRIVVTGEIDLDGRIEPIGGVKQKAIGAKRADADIFVVPSGNAEEARKYADGLQVIPVDTFDEALADLGATPTPVS
jgi:PDZ domain-containing protein